MIGEGGTQSQLQTVAYCRQKVSEMQTASTITTRAISEQGEPEYHLTGTGLEAFRA